MKVLAHTVILIDEIIHVDLVADAKSKSESGDWVYKVRGPPGHWKIIQIRKRN